MAIQGYRPTTRWGGLGQQVLDPTHDVLVLARQIDWEAITLALRPYDHKLGRYAKPIRLMVGLHLRKHRYDLSDEAVVQGVPENLSWMAFCGIDLGAILEQAKPGEPSQWGDASTLGKWRRRLGVEGTRRLERVVPQPLAREKVLQGGTMVTDTPTQETPIAYPTATALLDQGRRTLLRLLHQAKTAGVVVAAGLRRVTRTAKRVVLEATKLGKARLARIAAANHRLAGMAQHILHRRPRVLAQLSGQVGALRRWGQREAAAAPRRRRDQRQQTAGLVRRIIWQNAERFQGRHVPGTVLSRHEPHGVSICKGKRAKPAEYGCKVRVSIDRQGVVLTHTEYARTLADTETLPDAMQGWVAVVGQPPPEVAGDRGCHHPEADRARLGTVGGTPLSIPRTGKTRHPGADTAWFKRWQRLRARIDPVRSHLKADQRMDRCRYKGFAGDQLHVSWAVLAWNTKQWGRLLQQRLRARPWADRRAAYRDALPHREGFPIPMHRRESKPQSAKTSESHL
jgi:IS5 family transposase